MVVPVGEKSSIETHFPMCVPPFVVVAFVAVYTGRNSCMTYGHDAIVPADTPRVAPVSLAFAVIRYQFVICDGSVEPNPILAHIATLFVLKSVPIHVTAVQDTDATHVLSCFTSIVKFLSV